MADLFALSITNQPGHAPGANIGFDLNKPAVGISAWYGVFATDTDAEAAVVTVTKEDEETARKGKESRERMGLPPSEGSPYQGQSVGDVAFMAFEGEPRSAIQACASPG